MTFWFSKHLSSLIISVVSACLEKETTVGYENGIVDLAFSVTVLRNGLQTYQMTRTNDDTAPLTVVYQYGNLVRTTLNEGVESIGNISAGNLSIRIPSMNKAFADYYSLRSLRVDEDIKCIELIFRARPSIPVISNSDPSGNEVSGIEDKDITIVCSSTGGYPKPTMAWYRTSNQTAPLVNNTDQSQRDDRTYILEYKFRAIRKDNGATFVCQSSYDPPDPSYMQAEINLNLSLKSSTPMLSLETPLRESSNNMVIANCSSSGYKPDTARLTLMLEESTLIPVSNSYPSSNGTFMVTAEYTSTITKTLNGKLVTCSVNHTALDTPLIAQRSLDVQFAPMTAGLSGVSSGIVADVKNEITLTCKAGSSNPPSNITWYRNDIKIQSNSQIQHTSGPYNGNVTSQELVFEAVRDMDGDQIVCEVNNVVNGDNRLKSDTKTLDLRYHPTITLSDAKEATEGQPLTLRCQASAKPAPTFTWYHNRVVLLSGRSISSNSSSHINVLNIAAVNRRDVGVYQCNASNGYQPDDIKEINLTVKFKPLTASLTGEIRVVANGTNKVKLNCTTGTSNPKSTIVWYRNNTRTSSNASLQEHNGGFNGIVTSQILEFTADRYKDGEEIECTAYNDIKPQSTVASGKTKMDLLFHPIAELSDGAPVVEGKEKIFHCNVQSKPASSITWYHEETNLLTGPNTNYTIPVVNRSHAGTYRCEATNGYLPNGKSQTSLIVQYSPDVEVTTTNVTVNNSSTQVRCSPSGIPADYTFSDWQHIWPGVGPVDHKTGLGTNQTLTLTQLTYEYSGFYKCSVSNGIQGSINPNAGYGEAYLQVKTYPIITADGDLKVPVRLNKHTTATIAFYSNVKDNNVVCFIGNISHACSAVFMDGEVNLPVFNTTIKTSGTLAHISFSISSMDQFGVFNIRISNKIGYSERAIEVILEGPPQMPVEVSIVDTQSNYVILSWVPGFHGGFNQTFVIEYSIDGQTWSQENTVEIQGGLTLRRVNGTVSNLQSDTLYFMRLMARNEKGNSNYTRVFNVTTDLSQVHDVVTKNNLLLAVVGGLAAVIAIAVAVIVVLSIRLHSRKHAGDQPNSGNDMHYNTDRPVYDDLRYDGNPHTYSALGHLGNYEDLTHDTTGVQPYSNLNKEGASHAASLVDKTYENLQLSPLK